MKKLWLLALTFLLVVTPCMAIELNGSTLIYNQTMNIEVRDLLGSQPFIFVGVPTTLRYKFYYNVTELVMDTATITIDNQTHNLTYDIFDNQYKIQILFDSSEIGNYPYTINGSLAGFNDASRTATYQVRDYTTANFQVYTAINKSTKYSDGFAHIIAFPQNMSESEEYVELVKPFTYINDYIDLKIGIGTQKELFKTSQRVFYAPYNKDGTNLYLPANQSYTYYLVSGNHEFEGEYYSYMYYTKEYFNIYLVQDHIMNSTNYQMYVSSWDINYMGNVISIIIWVLAIALIFGIPFMVFQRTGNPEMLGKTMIIVIPLILVISLAIQGIVAWAM